MKIFHIIRTVLFAGLLAALNGCGGGGSNAPAITPTDPNQEFSLSTLKSTDPGTVYSTPLTGSDSDGGQWVGSLSIANRTQEMLDGILVTPQDVLVSLSFEGRSSRSGSTSYIDTSGYVLVSRDQDGTICTPAFPYQLPDFVKVGDFGLAPIDRCFDNTTSESNWRVEDAGNQNINFITSVLTGDDASSVGESTATLNIAGDILAYKIVVSSSKIPTVTLRSK
jgi:hypothetical protein